MNLSQAIEQRHAVRSYLNQAIPTETVTQLQTEIDACNQESGLTI